jgi:hypothetical protein
MKIVITDKIYLDRRHRSSLEAVGNVATYDDVPSLDQLIYRIRDADIAIVGFAAVPAPALK